MATQEDMERDMLEHLGLSAPPTVAVKPAASVVDERKKRREEADAHRAVYWKAQTEFQAKLAEETERLRAEMQAKIEGRPLPTRSGLDSAKVAPSCSMCQSAGMLASGEYCPCSAGPIRRANDRHRQMLAAMSKEGATAVMSSDASGRAARLDVTGGERLAKATKAQEQPWMPSVDDYDLLPDA